MDNLSALRLAILKARVNHCRPARLFVNLELERLERHESFTVRLSRKQHDELQLWSGEEVFVELRNVELFPDDK